MQTRRYRALQRIIYAAALVQLVKLARSGAGETFQFGPMDITTLERNGLLVSGTDLSGVAETLAKVPGLVEVPA